MTKRLGRPPLDTRSPSTRLELRVPTKNYAAIRTYATQSRMSVSEWVRSRLAIDMLRWPSKGR